MVGYDLNPAPNLTVQCILLLKSFGANIDAVDCFGTTKLMLACTIGNSLIIQTLIEAGANVNHFRPCYPKVTPCEPCTPLQVAACAGYLEAVKKLIELGADPKVFARSIWRNTLQTMTAYDFAVQSGHQDIIDYLKPYTEHK
jgi:ankyrin repeat protein